MTTVSQILQSKGSNQVWTVTPDITMQEVLQMMIDKNVGALPVVEADKLVGIISERDYITKVALSTEVSLDTPVGTVMTREVCYVYREQTIEQCMALMTDKRVRHLPVLVGEELVGIVSIGDVVKTIIAHQEFIIEQLEHYITTAVQ